MRRAEDKMIVVGLGNPGATYERTRHNLGFAILEALAREHQAEFKLIKKYLAEIAQITINATELILAKPLTFMNDSGKAVKILLAAYALKPNKLIVLQDEIDLPLGKIRLSSGGSAGHKGIESIIKTIGRSFSRLRIGIDNRKQYRVPPTEIYVLQKFTAEEQKILQTKIVPQTIDKIKSVLNPTSKRKA